MQGLNDFFVSGLLAVASFGSGAILHAYGWEYVQYAMIPALLIAGASVLWLVMTDRSALDSNNGIAQS